MILIALIIGKTWMGFYSEVVAVYSNLYEYNYRFSAFPFE